MPLRIRVPRPDEIVEIHDQILEETGGVAGVLNRGAIGSSVERARWGPFPTGDDLWERVAFLVRGIAQDHPFVDGNKRTAFQAADYTLSLNGWYLAAEEEEAIAWIVRVARGLEDLAGISKWIREHARPFDEHPEPAEQGGDDRDA